MKHRLISTALIAVALVGFIGLGVKDVKQTQIKSQVHEVQLKDTQADFKELELKYDNLNTQLEHVDKTKTEEVKKLQDEKLKLEQEKKDLESQLQARREEKERIAKLQTTQKAYAATAPVRASQAPVGGDWVARCHAWAGQAGFSLPDAAIKLIDRESDCNPCVINGGVIDCGYTGGKAYGIGQALPSTKTGCGSEPVCQIRWMRNYVMSRYGSWENALAHSYANNWY